MPEGEWRYMQPSVFARLAAAEGLLAPATEGPVIERNRWAAFTDEELLTFHGWASYAEAEGFDDPPERYPLHAGMVAEIVAELEWRGQDG